MLGQGPEARGTTKLRRFYGFGAGAVPLFAVRKAVRAFRERDASEPVFAGEAFSCEFSRPEGYGKAVPSVKSCQGLVTSG